jgi:hypothetical protein
VEKILTKKADIKGGYSFLGGKFLKSLPGAGTGFKFILRLKDLM